MMIKETFEIYCAVIGKRCRPGQLQRFLSRVQAQAQTQNQPYDCVEMKEKGVGVVGVVLDTVGDDGKQDDAAVKKAGVLQEKTKASYPFLIPDSTMMNGRLNGISAFPETFFVDKEGNIVGETYSGSHSLDEWKKIVEKELANVSK